MANFGLSKPWIAKLDAATGTYSGGFKCGMAVNTSISPSYNEASMFADNQEREHVKEFKNAAVSLGTDRLPVQASKTVFGHTVNADGEENNNVSDEPNYVGYGFVTCEKLDGKTKYRACILLKVLFSEGEESYETKGESIVFKAPTISGIAMADSNGNWRRKSPYFNTEEEADLWIQKQLNVVAVCAAPVASVDGGSYTEEQIVILTSATAGAKIKYTTDGTTPTAENGEEYSAPITIASNTGLRAFAYKDGMADSEMITKEYFITV